MDVESLRDRKEVRMPRMQRLSGDYEIRYVRRRQIIWSFVGHRKDSGFHSEQGGKPLEESEQRRNTF